MQLLSDSGCKKCALRIERDCHCMTTTALKMYLGHPHYCNHVFRSEGPPVHIQFITDLCSCKSIYTKHEHVISTSQCIVYVAILLHELCRFVSLQKAEPSQAQVGMWYIISTYIPSPPLFVYWNSISVKLNSNNSLTFHLGVCRLWFDFSEKKHQHDPDGDSGMGPSIFTDTKSSIFSEVSCHLHH